MDIKFISYKNTKTILDLSDWITNQSYKNNKILQWIWKHIQQGKLLINRIDGYYIVEYKLKIIHDNTEIYLQLYNTLNNVDIRINNYIKTRFREPSNINITKKVSIIHNNISGPLPVISYITTAYLNITENTNTEKCNNWGLLVKLININCISNKRHNNPTFEINTNWDLQTPTYDFYKNNCARIKFREKIIDEYFKNKLPSLDNNPDMVLMMGAPGSGKNKLLDSLNYNKNKYIILNIDDIIAMLPEYWYIILNINHFKNDWIQLFRIEARTIQNMIFKKAVLNKYSIIWNGCGGNLKNSYNMVKLSRSFNFNITLICVYIDLETSLQRVKNRASKYHRSVPVNVVKNIHKKIISNFWKLSRHVNTSFLYTSKTTPSSLVWCSNNNNSITMEKNTGCATSREGPRQLARRTVTSAISSSLNRRCP